jgi:GTP-binding protein HflX
MDGLVDQCLELIADAFGQMDLLIPHSRYDLIAKLHAVGHIQHEEERDNGVFLKVRLSPGQAGVYQPFVVQA